MLAQLARVVKARGGLFRSKGKEDTQHPLGGWRRSHGAASTGASAGRKKGRPEENRNPYSSPVIVKRVEKRADRDYGGRVGGASQVRPIR
jgi:hypothetical protein